MMAFDETLGDRKVAADAKQGYFAAMQKGRNEEANGNTAPKACCGSPRKMK